MPPPPPRKPKREAFIGNDSQTMMTDETFAEFEARMQAEAEAAAQQPEGDDASDTGDEEAGAE